MSDDRDIAVVWGDLSPEEYDRRMDRIEQVIRAGKASGTTWSDGLPRQGSKLDAIGPGKAPRIDSEDNFFASVALAKSRDADEQAMGKAQLAAMGSHWADVEPGKATIGDTDANGGYMVPTQLRRTILEASSGSSRVVDLFTDIRGVISSPIPINTEGAAPTRAVVWVPGQLKENVDFTVAQYSATMYVLARIFDVGNQLLKRSQGAADNLVRSKLARAFALGENYYIVNGAGTTEPLGLIPAIAASPASLTTAHSATDNTVAGSFRAGIAKAVEALAARGREATGIIANSGDVAHALAQGTDTAGFFVDESGLVTLFGIPVRKTVSIASKTALVGDFKAMEVYFGDSYRVDTSDQAGTRWDYNLTGFRGEEEMGFQADAYTQAGLVQRVTGLIP